MKAVEPTIGSKVIENLQQQLANAFALYTNFRLDDRWNYRHKPIMLMPILNSSASRLVPERPRPRHFAVLKPPASAPLKSAIPGP
jgi:hypothetical protein